VLRAAGPPEKAIAYAYELLRRHFTHPDAHMTYASVVEFGNERIDLPEPGAAGPGVAVTYRNEATGEQETTIIEDSPEPAFTRSEIPPDQILGKALKGKTIGEPFPLRDDPFQPITGTITGLASKYAWRFADTLAKWESRFPDIPFARGYSMPTNPDGSPDLSVLFAHLDAQEAHVQALHQVYRDNPISVTTFARLSHRTVTESLHHLATQEDLTIRCCRGTDEEYEDAAQALRVAERLVIDISTLATLWMSGLFRHLSQFPIACETTTGVVDEFRHLLPSAARRPHLSTFKRGGQYYRQEWSADQARAHEEQRSEFLAWVTTGLRVVDGLDLAGLPPERRQQLIDFFGQPSAECLARSAATRAVSGPTTLRLPNSDGTRWEFDGRGARAFLIGSSMSARSPTTPAQSWLCS
jgi:hypothetical protein